MGGRVCPATLREKVIGKSDDPIPVKEEDSLKISKKPVTCIKGNGGACGWRRRFNI